MLCFLLSALLCFPALLSSPVSLFCPHSSSRSGYPTTGILYLVESMNKQETVSVATINMNTNNNTTINTANKQDGKFSAFLPPPPIFKPRFVHMQRSNSLSDSPPTPSLKTSTGAGANSSKPSSTPVGSQTSTLISTPFSSVESLDNVKIQNNTTTNNSNFLTSSFVSNEEYRSHFLSHSPSISPMTRYTDMPLPDSGDASSANTSTAGNNKLNPNPPIRQAKKRRRSSAYNKEEIERKKKELKTQHSIIEKRRRIKMNREFEALKFLVPACRLNILTGLNDGNFDNSTMMHKLTILQSTVEYIKYLHLIIKLMKLQMLIPKDTRETFKSWIQKNDNLNFVDFDLDLQSYRDIKSEFNFENIFLKVWENDGSVPNDWLDPITKEIIKVLSPSAESTSMKTSEQPPTSRGRPQRDASESSQSHVNILTPSSILVERIQENSEYRNSILRLQQESNSFKLPLPAIIDKHPDLGILNSGSSRSNAGLVDLLPSPSSPSYVANTVRIVTTSPFSNTHSPVTSSSVPAYRMSTTNSTTSPLKQVLPPPFVNPSRPLFPGGSTTPRNHFSSMPSDYPLGNSGSNSNGAMHRASHGSNSHRTMQTAETRLRTERNKNALLSPDQLFHSSHTGAPASASSPVSGSASVSVSPERKGSSADRNSPEIQAASRLLIEIKGSKRHPSIRDILN